MWNLLCFPLYTTEGEINCSEVLLNPLNKVPSVTSD